MRMSGSSRTAAKSDDDVPVATDEEDAVDPDEEEE